ncbi:BRO family protein [Nocardia terpenica]|uniref:BRO family protein n=1 Tax=Nocardia terpenica TaxID=455432 RepID=UPI002FDFBC53
MTSTPPPDTPRTAADRQLAVPASAPSVFDDIKQIRPDGSEYWSARDLMPLLGYDKWQNFEAAIDRTRAAIHNQNMPVTSHVTDAGKLVQRSQGGSTAKADFELSRFACYLVAMNGDPRKPEVAAAQAYFAARTREAEVRAEMSPFDLMRAQIDRLEAAQRTADEAKAIAEKAETAAEKSGARLDAIEGRHDWYAALGYARLHGLNTSAQALNRLGRAATAVAKDNGIEPVKVPHQLYGTVNSYPAWVWELACEADDTAIAFTEDDRRQ